MSTSTSISTDDSQYDSDYDNIESINFLTRRSDSVPNIKIAKPLSDSNKKRGDNQDDFDDEFPKRRSLFRKRLSSGSNLWEYLTSFSNKLNKSKKADSYGAKPSSPVVPSAAATKSQSLEGHGYVNPLEGGDQQQPQSQPQHQQETETNIAAPVTSEVPLTPNKTSPEGSEGATSPSEKKPLTRTLTQPQNTVEYVVSSTDTLNRIAARFDTTPSELVNLNRLLSRFIFPGQTLYIPKKGDQTSQSEGSFDGGQKSPLEKDAMSSPKPGHVERVQSPSPVSKNHGFFGAGSGSMGSSTEDNKEQIGGGLPFAPNIEINDKDASGHDIDEVKFLKINSKHITDGQGFVSGVLIVTPNALMFDPNVSDTLVIEHGVELYGVIAPIENMMRAAIYFDIAHMRVKDAQDNLSPANKPKIYLGPGSSPIPSATDECVAVEPTATTPLPESAEKLNIKPDVPDLISFEHPNEAAVAADDNQTDKTLDSFDLVMPASSSGSDLNLMDVSKQQRSDSIEVMVSTPPPDLIAEGVDNVPVILPQSDSDVTLATTLTQEETEEVANAEKLGRSATVREGSRNTQSRRERMLKRLSYPVESLSSYTQSSISKILSSSPRNLVDFSSGLFVRSGGTTEEEGGEERPDGKDTTTTPGSEYAQQQLINVGYKNMVEEKPNFFAEVDKLLPRPARQYEGQPLYLCLRMGHPLNKKPQRSTPIESYSKKRMKKEYWFSIPRNRVDDLYNFFQRWSPQVYGDVDEVTPEEMGFKPIESDAEDEEDEVDGSAHDKKEELEASGDGRKKSTGHGPLSFLKLVEGHFTADGANSPFDWELVSMSEAELNSPDPELPLPDLSDPSEIFSEDHRKELCKNFPARAEGYPWSLIYSTSKNGFSLKTMYREMAKYETPVLLGIMDTQGTVFGAVISCSLKISDHFYGTGESFLFTFHPDFKCYHWTGENMYFIKGNAESLAIGSGDGMFGIWLDGDLYHGRSHKCKTFGNESPLSSTEDFVVKTLEAWGFV